MHLGREADQVSVVAEKDERFHRGQGIEIKLRWRTEAGELAAALDETGMINWHSYPLGADSVDKPIAELIRCFVDTLYAQVDRYARARKLF